MKKVYIVLLSVVSMLLGCGDDDVVVTTNQSQDLCDSLDILYSNDIAPILANAGCSGSYCHGSGVAGITLTDYSTTKTSAENPKFLKAIKHELSASPMPKNGPKLSDSDIQKIECWIQNGYRE